MASHPNRHPIPPASNVSGGERKQTSSASSTTRHPIPPASNLSHHKVKRTPSSTARHRPSSNLSHGKGKWTSSSPSTATCPTAALPSSSSIDDLEIQYDVFLSFRGTDTRSNFLSHLRKELFQKKIKYYVDDQNLKQGDEISSTLLSAIKKSEISLIVFSKNYAYSRWCLEELEQIIECMENQKQTVLPIFYKVVPSTVRHQKESYKDAFDKLGKKFDQHKLQKWKTALKKAADLSGFDSSSYNTEATLIEAIVERLLITLNETGDQDDLKGFVGMDKHIRYFETKFSTISQGIFIIGIWGMSGIGKTTIAEILYKRLHNRYDGSYFLHVRDRHITKLKKDLLSTLLDEKVCNVMPNGIPTDIKRRLHRKKVLVILDDIWDSNQLETLTGGHDWFGSGSSIIMISRDRSVFSEECDEIYPVRPLNFEEALQLFENVLKKDCLVKKQEYCELSKKIVNYAKGVPLVIKVLGCYLYSKDKDEWESKLRKLERMPHPKIQKVLELSFNELDDDQHKDIFLYLACYFRCEAKERIIFLLNACGYETTDGLRALQDKALITISNKGIVSVNDLFQDMGHEIVHKKFRKDLGHCSHLCDPQDIYNVFKNKMGTPSIESIRLDIFRLEKDLQLGPRAFHGIDNLRFLLFGKFVCESENRYIVYPPEEGFELLPNELRSFIWIEYPSKSFPLRSCVENLVELYLRESNLRKLWDGLQDLPRLKVLDLNGSKYLIEVSDLSKAPNLEQLYLNGCPYLSHVRIWPNHNVADLVSTKCEKREKIGVGSQVSLGSLGTKVLNCGCGPHHNRNIAVAIRSFAPQWPHLPIILLKAIKSQLQLQLRPQPKFRTMLGTEELGKDDHLDLCGTSMPTKPCLKYYMLPSLQIIHLNFCKRLTELPDDIGLCLPSLKELELWGSKLKTLPASIKYLSKLTHLSIVKCTQLRCIPELPPSIETFSATDCALLKTLQFTSNSMPLSHQKHKLIVSLYNCMEVNDHELEAIARHYILTTQRIISASIKDSFTCLAIPRSRVPEWFSRYKATQDLVSVPLDLPLPSKAMGFIFYFAILKNSILPSYHVKIRCHIELSKVPNVTYLARAMEGNLISDHVAFWYDSSFSLKIMKEVSKRKALAIIDDHYVRVQFELLVKKSRGPVKDQWVSGNYWHGLKEWGVYLTNTKRCPNIIDNDEGDYENFNGDDQGSTLRSWSQSRLRLQLQFYHI